MKMTSSLLVNDIILYFKQMEFVIVYFDLEIFQRMLEAFYETFKGLCILYFLTRFVDSLFK